MSKVSRSGWMALWGVAVFLAAGVVPFAQGPTGNPYRPVRGLADGGGPSVPGGEWAKLAGGKWDRRRQYTLTLMGRVSGRLSGVTTATFSRANPAHACCGNTSRFGRVHKITPGRYTASSRRDYETRKFQANELEVTE